MFRRVTMAALVGGLGVIGLAGPLLAATKTIDRPMFNGNRLDWCARWGEDCGQPAADAYCALMGFAGATHFVKDGHIGGRSPTRLIATGAVCDAAQCDGFARITCQKVPTTGADNTTVVAKPVARTPGPATAVVVPLPTPSPGPPKAATVVTEKKVAATPVEAAPGPAIPPQTATAETELPPVTEGSGAVEKEALPFSATGDAAPASSGATVAEAKLDHSTASIPGAPDAFAARFIAVAAIAPPAVAKPVELGKPPQIEAFDEPLFRGRRLDWCRGWKDSCGKSAADNFCRLNGFLAAVSFTPDRHIGGTQPTRQIASGMVCDQDTCDGFKLIVCTD